MRLLTGFILFSMLFVSACGGGTADAPGANELAPSDESQIKQTVEDYFRRDPELPPYTAEVEEVSGTWARVSLVAEGVETDEKVYVYVQDQVNDPEPVPTVEIDISQPRNDAEGTTELGWAIVTKPQAQFTDEELDAAMIPEDIRP